MTVYDELVKELRSGCDTCKLWDGSKCCLDGYCNFQMKLQAADAIEELDTLLDGVSADNDALCETIERLKKPRWIPIESRPMDEEERQYYSEHYGYNLTDDEAVIYCCQLPEHGQEVLVCGRYGRIWIDTFDDDPDYGVGFEGNGDMDGIVAWMPLPEPPKEET